MSVMTANIYKALTEETAINLAISKGLFQPNSTLSCEEIGDGNLNLVFRIKDSQSGKSIIIKQALPYAKVVGESWPLTLHRATIEAEALKISAKICPDYVPEVYFSDDVLAVTIMEDLSHLSIARTGFLNGETYPLISQHLGEFLAKTLFYTSDYGLGASDKKEWAKKFINPELCKITEDLIFTDPFYNSSNNSFEEGLRKDVEELWNDEELKFHASILKKSFLTEAEVLLHGDLHTGSVFASPKETKVIDPEFAFYGPAGFDIGQVIANLAFQVIVNEKERNTFIQHIETVWKVFVKEFSRLWKEENKEAFAVSDEFSNYILKKYFSDSLGFAGCELIRRTVGLAHVADLDSISEDERRLSAKRKTLEIGKNLIKERSSIKSIEQLSQQLRELL